MNTHMELRDYMEGFDSLYEFRVEQATDAVAAGLRQVAGAMEGVADTAENLWVTMARMRDAYGAWAAADNEDGAHESD